MKPFSLLAAALSLGFAASAPAMETLTVSVEGVSPGSMIPDANVLCVPTPDGKNGVGKNIRPTVSWSVGPAGTKSYAIILSDPDVPADLSLADKAQPIDENAPRQTFYHWAQVNISKNDSQLQGGTSLDRTMGMTLENDVMPTSPRSYGGPCPPWNDQRIHHYHFTVLALDVNPDMPRNTKASETLTSLKPHVLAMGEVVGTYTTNAGLRSAK